MTQDKDRLDRKIDYSFKYFNSNKNIIKVRCGKPNKKRMKILLTLPLLNCDKLYFKTFMCTVNWTKKETQYKRRVSATNTQLFCYSMRSKKGEIHELRSFAMGAASASSNF